MNGLDHIRSTGYFVCYQRTAGGATDVLSRVTKGPNDFKRAANAIRRRSADTVALRTATERLSVRWADVERQLKGPDADRYFGDVLGAEDSRTAFEKLPAARKRAVIESMVTVRSFRSGMAAVKSSTRSWWRLFPAGTSFSATENYAGVTRPPEKRGRAPPKEFSSLDARKD
jgi:hypothetical protein